MLKLTSGMVPWSPGTQVPWSPGTQAGYLSFQWSKWAGKKILRKNIVFWQTSIIWSTLSDTLFPWSQDILGGYLSFLGSKWDVGKNLRKNIMFWTSSVFNQFNQTHWPNDHPVTRHTGGLSQLPIVKMSLGKKYKKKPSVHNIFCFLVNFIRQTISASTGWNELGKNSKKKPHIC